MNAALLRRYVNGECTPQEVEQIKVWLESKDNPYPFPEGIEASQLEAQLWNAIARSNQKDANRTIGWAFYRTVAACVALLLVAGGLRWFYCTTDIRKDFKYANSTSSRVERFEVGGFDFALSPNSRMKISGTKCQDYSQLGFSGIIQLKNVSKETRTIRFYWDAEGKAPEEILVRCEVGRTYLLIPDKTQESKFVMIDRKHVTLLPMPLLRLLEQESKLI